tara:strand:+ start:80 stop:325 length:246 start_codon:yes stop_codon:yes gene_type:complete
MKDFKNLFELLKPEAKKNLVRNIVRYPVAVNLLISTLKKNYAKSDLAVSDVSSLHAFTGLETPTDAIDYIYCTNIFEPYDK